MVSSQPVKGLGEDLVQMQAQQIPQRLPNKLSRKPLQLGTSSTWCQRLSNLLQKLRITNLPKFPFSHLTGSKDVLRQLRDFQADGISKAMIPCSVWAVVALLRVVLDECLSILEIHSTAISQHKLAPIPYTCLAAWRALWAKKIERSTKWLKQTSVPQVVHTCKNNGNPIHFLFRHVSGVVRHVSRASNLDALRMSYGFWIIDLYS